MNLIFLLMFIIITIGCRSYSIRAQKKLSIEDKAKLLDYGSSRKNFMPLIVLFVGLFAIIFIVSNVGSYVAFITVALGVPILLISLIQYLYKNLKTLGLPEKYLRTMLMTNTIFYVAVISYLLSLYLG